MWKIEVEPGADKPFVLMFNGSAVSRHETIEAAQASVPRPDAQLQTDDEPIPWVSPYAFALGETGDGRRFEEFSHRDLPLTLWIQREQPEWGGHVGAVAVGRIDEITLPTEADPVGTMSGVFATSQEGLDAAQTVSEQIIRGLSVDPGHVEAYFETILDDEGEPVGEMLVFSMYEVAGATIVGTPAFAEARIEIDGDMPDAGDGEGEGADDEAASQARDLDAELAEIAAEEAGDQDGSPFELVAAGGRPAPPDSYFARPPFKALSGLTITEPDANGYRRIHGHVAPKQGSGVCHVGFDGCKEAPPSPTEYASYTGGGHVITASGERIETGLISYGKGHPKRMGLSEQELFAHYNDPRYAVAQVATGDDEFGWWVAGIVFPDVDEDKVRKMRAGKLSGHWKRINGHTEGLAVTFVNVPGYPMPKPQLAMTHGSVDELVAVGVNPVKLTAGVCGCGGASTPTVDQGQLDRIERMLNLATEDRQLDMLESTLRR